MTTAYIAYDDAIDAAETARRAAHRAYHDAIDAYHDAIDDAIREFRADAQVTAAHQARRQRRLIGEANRAASDAYTAWRDAAQAASKAVGTYARPAAEAAYTAAWHAYLDAIEAARNMARDAAIITDDEAGKP